MSLRAPTFIRDWLTDPTNEHYEMWRAMSGVSFLIAMGLQIYDIGWRSAAFDLERFAWGTGVLLFTASGGTALKDFVASRSRAPTAPTPATPTPR